MSEEFTDKRLKPTVYHLLRDNREVDFVAACGSKEAEDFENRGHVLTNQAARVNCPKCRELINAQLSDKKP